MRFVFFSRIIRLFLSVLPNIFGYYDYICDFLVFLVTFGCYSPKPNRIRLIFGFRRIFIVSPEPIRTRLVPNRNRTGNVKKPNGTSMLWSENPKNRFNRTEPDWWTERPGLLQTLGVVCFRCKRHDDDDPSVVGKRSLWLLSFVFNP